MAFTDKSWGRRVVGRGGWAEAANMMEGWGDSCWRATTVGSGSTVGFRSPGCEALEQGSLALLEVCYLPDTL